MENQLRESHFQLGQMKGKKIITQTIQLRYTPKTTQKSKQIMIKEGKVLILLEHLVYLKTSRWAKISI